MRQRKKMNMMSERLHPINEVANYIALSLLTKQMTVSPLKLQKLLYYAQAWSMVFFGRNKQLFADVPQAWVNGPVYPAIYNIWKNRNMCDHLTPNDFGTTEEKMYDALGEVTKQMQLSDDEIQLLEQVVLKYGSKSQNYLIFLTHSELPWCEKREGLKPYERSTNPLSLDTMHQYYLERHVKNMARRKETARVWA